VPVYTCRQYKKKVGKTRKKRWKNEKKSWKNENKKMEIPRK